MENSNFKVKSKPLRSAGPKASSMGGSMLASCKRASAVNANREIARCGEDYSTPEEKYKMAMARTKGPEALGLDYSPFFSLRTTFRATQRKAQPTNMWDKRNDLQGWAGH